MRTFSLTPHSHQPDSITPSPSYIFPSMFGTASVKVSETKMRSSRLVEFLALVLLLADMQIGDSFSVRSENLTRRDIFQTMGSAAVAVFTASYSPTLASAATPSIATKFDKDILNIPAPSVATELNGVDNLYFPSFLAGEWEVTQTLVDTATPLGLKFVGGPNAVEQIAQDTMTEARKNIGKPVSLRLRYIPTKWGVGEDRLFNAKQRLDAFAGKSVVAGVDYANTSGSNRPSVLAMGGTEQDPLQTTVVRFKGPAAQKTFVISHGVESLSDNQWAGYELDRSIFALTNQSTAPPLTTDSELIWFFEKKDKDHVQGKLRIAGYLNPQSDKLYFEARNRAVSIQDYTLEMKRIA